MINGIVKMIILNHKSISTHICVFFYKYIRRICISSACFHQIFPNASDQISLALFCTFRERGWEGEGGRVGGWMRGAGYLPLCGCLGNTRMRSHPPFPPLSSIVDKTGLQLGTDVDVWEFVTFYPPAEIYLPSAG